MTGPKIVVVGAGGQLSGALEREGLTCLGLDRVDFTQPDTIASAIAAEAPDVVINAAAYTAVDKAEAERALADQINGHAVGDLARACAATGAALIHISTDYVYAGTKGDGPYREDDPVDPVNAYGASKLLGEQAALAANPRTVILRTAWVYAPWGGNFVKTMLRLSGRERLTVVSDQHGQPTSAIDLGRACLTIAPQISEKSADAGCWGVYHYAGAGPTTWAHFAEEIFVQGKTAGLIGNAPVVAHIATTEYPTPAARPANSTLDCSRIQAVFSVTPRPWREALAETLALMKPEDFQA